MTGSTGPSPVFQVTGQGTVVLTANQRLARYLEAQADDAQRLQGKTAWARPPVLPLLTWVQREWEEELEPHTLLSGPQLMAVWENIVEHDTATPDVLDRRRLAETAAEAWELCRSWGIDPARWSGLSPETEVFARWSTAFKSRCDARRWIDRRGVLARLTELYRLGARAVPSSVRLVGFDTVPPDVERLLTVLKEAGSEVTVDTPAAAGGNIVRVTADDPVHEAVLAARWARRLLEAGEAGPIGIVSTDVGAVRFALARALRDRLSPGAVADWNGRSPVNFSLGEPLSQVPVVAAALAFLSVDRRPVEAARWSGLFRSPFLAASEQEASVRALAADRLIDKGPRAVSLAGLIEWLPDGLAVPCPELERVLSAWGGAIGRQDGRRTPSSWARVFQAQLESIGWPGQGSLDSAAYQAVKKWDELLGSFAALDAVVSSIDRQNALYRLQRMCYGETFQPQGVSAPVQVVGTLEASGMVFSHLWVMGLSDHVWPAPPSPNPFIPYGVQRELKLPHGSADVELEYARTVTERLLAAASDVVLSHPKQVEGREVGPSPLITAIAEADAGTVAPAPNVRYAESVRQAGRVEAVDDWKGPPLTGAGSSGGVSVFTDQSDCPFKAFAHHRLGIRGLEEPELGLDPREQGEVVHKVLELVWAHLGDQATLKAIPQDELDDIVAGAVASALPKFLKSRNLGARFHAIEQRRLTKLVLDWLSLDASREEPFAVTCVEQKTEAKIGGVRVSMKVDRIDTLENGREVLIDYKTGEVSRSDWKDDRPKAPQLPLYLMIREKGVPGAIAFASLKRGNTRYVGLAEQEGALPRARDTVLGEEGWRDTVAGWRRTLTALAEGFSRGEAAVDPRPKGDPCQYCDLTLLCRINERGGETPKDG
ncbi:MAG: PD-(D/E)XK nuclease family protein [Leptospirillia bacterium]